MCGSTGTHTSKLQYHLLRSIHDSTPGMIPFKIPFEKFGITRSNFIGLWAGKGPEHLVKYMAILSTGHYKTVEGAIHTIFVGLSIMPIKISL